MNTARRLRYEKGVSARDVAEATGVSVGTVYNVESGDEPTAQVARSLANYYGVSSAQLLGLEPLPLGFGTPEAA